MDQTDDTPRLLEQLEHLICGGAAVEDAADYIGVERSLVSDWLHTLSARA
jgi:hypothetical protein